MTSARGSRPTHSTSKPNLTIDQDSRNMTGAPRLNRGFTDVNSNKNDSDFPQNYQNPITTSRGAHSRLENDMDHREDLKRKLQIFQSESKWEDYEYMDDESVNREQVQQFYDDDEVRSSFHPEIKEQMNQVKIHKGILKNNPPAVQQIVVDNPKMRRREKLLE